MEYQAWALTCGVPTCWHKLPSMGTYLWLLHELGYLPVGIIYQAWAHELVYLPAGINYQAWALTCGYYIN
ncbi:hypothetical protein XELAEV_18046276mg [Xenopus laevis]|uniref:Uncharacterized protein n=1 Tax=Xenopus laevis TaxID=8355 RepID=A0A974H0R8_XENLA|nr:hypothetical protein XELAEV_18046276mg [Xenopus laevis]